jgi:hypothetical protein
MPLDYLLSHFLKAVLDLRDVDILTPGLLALATGLLVLRGRCCFRVRHGDYLDVEISELWGW